MCNKIISMSVKSVTHRVVPSTLRASRSEPVQLQSLRNCPTAKDRVKISRAGMRREDGLQARFVTSEDCLHKLLFGQSAACCVGYSRGICSVSCHHDRRSWMGIQNFNRGKVGLWGVITCQNLCLSRLREGCYESRVREQHMMLFFFN